MEVRDEGLPYTYWAEKGKRKMQNVSLSWQEKLLAVRSDGEESLWSGAVETFHTSDSGTEKWALATAWAKQLLLQLWPLECSSQSSASFGVTGSFLPTPTDPHFHVQSQKGSGCEGMPKCPPVQPHQSQAIHIPASAKGCTGAALQTRLPKTFLWSALLRQGSLRA